MAHKVTILDIARLAKVSTTTVSRVLHNKPDVDPATRERILRIVEEQGFVPSITAAGLAAGRNPLISVLVPALTWPLIPELLLSVASVVESTSYEMVLYSISSTNHERDCGKIIDRILATRLTAGLLAVFPGQSSQHLTRLRRQGFPVVLIDDQSPPPEGIPWIGADNRRGAYEATRHLIELGHRRIAHIQGPLKYCVSHERYQGYCDALQEAGLEVDPALVLEGDFMPAGGQRCALDLLSRPAGERPTAIFAASDYMAYGVIAAAETLGLRIPQDLALVGFDDNPASAHLRPALTTVRQPVHAMGEQAIKLLLEMIEQEQMPRRRRQSVPPTAEEPPREVPHLVLPTSLVIRESCGALQRHPSALLPEV